MDDNYSQRRNNIKIVISLIGNQQIIETSNFNYQILTSIYQVYLPSLLNHFAR